MTIDMPARGDPRKRHTTESFAWFLATVGLSLVAAWILIS